MSLQFFWTVVILKFNNVLHRSMVSLDFPLGFKMSHFGFF